MIDHVVYGVSDLEAGIDAVERLLGVRPARGGRHPQLGTHNALLGLGPERYLEVIAPDPERAEPRLPATFGLDSAALPSVVAWYVRCPEIDSVLAKIDFEFGPVMAGRRDTPSGDRIDWRNTDPRQVREHGVVPFVIDWGTSLHPASSAPAGCSLVELALEHPVPARIRPVLDALGVEVRASEAAEPAIIAVLATPHGRVELR